MKRRLYFILPDIHITRQIVDELLLARVESRRMHVMAKDDVVLTGLPEATLFQKSDLVHGTELGLVIGGIAGVLAGTFIAVFTPEGLGPTGAIILGLGVGGAVTGAWSASMVAVNIPNTRLQLFHEAIEHDHVLLMIDVEKEAVDEVSALIRKHHPEADAHGVEPSIPAFP